MRRVEVKTTGGDYDILIGPGLLQYIPDYLASLGFTGKVVIITNPVLRDLYGNSLKDKLAAVGFNPALLEVPEGEENKSLEQAGKLYTGLSSFQAERTTPVLALGGGVIGDLAGFVAATYMRGMPLVQVPTTLLSQVDSSIGGKTAVNYGKLKNTIGAFYQPKLVAADISTLKTLPEDEFVNGLAEIIKYGIIRDEGLFRLLESAGRKEQKEEAFLEEIIFRCASIKAAVVGEDEKDTGLRNILNFGHTVGHAIETVSDFRVGHGKAVAAGMIAAGRVSQKMGLLPPSELNRIESIIVKNGLPVNFQGLDVQKIMLAIKHDKKRIGGQIRMVLARNIGDVLINDKVSPVLVQQVLEELYEKAEDMRHHSRE